MLNIKSFILQWSATKKLLLFLVIIFISRLPFILPGFGMDPDAWRIVLSANKLYDTGLYTPSRLPGFPVPEFIYFILLEFTNGILSPLSFNLATAFIGLLSLVFFYLILTKLSINNRFVLLLPLAFSPLFYINSVNSMDYVWALTFILASFYYCITGYNIGAGILLGIAVGARLSSLAFLIPICYWIIFPEYNQERLKWALNFCLVTLLTSIIIFFPVYSNYGIHIFSYDKLIYPSFLIILGRMTIKIWGVIGVFIIGGIFLYIVIKRKRYPIVTLDNQQKKIINVSIIVMIIYLLLFIRLPMESGYLLPIVPFFIILLGIYMDKKLAVTLAIGMIISCFFLNVERSGVSIIGIVPKDHSTRIEDLNNLNSKVNQAIGMKVGSLKIISESSYPKLEVLGIRDNISEEINSRFIYLPTISEIDSLINAGVTLYYLESAKEGLLLYYNNENLFSKLKKF